MERKGWVYESIVQVRMDYEVWKREGRDRMEGNERMEEGREER